MQWKFPRGIPQTISGEPLVSKVKPFSLEKTEINKLEITDMFLFHL